MARTCAAASACRTPSRPKVNLKIDSPGYDRGAISRFSSTVMRREQQHVLPRARDAVARAAVERQSVDARTVQVDAARRRA